jgi:glycosyltransferase involved in cell wall biosynthesis
MKILFMAEVGSIHVARWINQLQDTGWDLRVFQPVPSTYGVRSEFQTGFFYLPYETNKPQNLKVEYTLPIKSKTLIARVVRKIINQFKIIPGPEKLHAKYLADIIDKWQPDVIHSLGLFVNWRNNSRALLDAHEILGGKFPCPWIVSTWGADLELYPTFGENEHSQTKMIMSSCDGLIIEGDRDLPLAEKFGFKGKVLAKLPAYGGVTWKKEDFTSPGLSSSRNVILLKGRDNTDSIKSGGDPQGRAMTAMKAFALCKELLHLYSIVIVQATPAIETEAKVLAATTGLNFHVFSNTTSLPYHQWLQLMGAARVLIATTAYDGLPSTLIEAMALGAFPIHSGLETIREWIKDGENGLLVPAEDEQAVAIALRRALSDDDLVNHAAELNADIIKNQLSDAVIRPKVIALYQSLAQK